MTRRVCGCQSKQDAVSLVTTHGVSVAQGAKDLEVHANMLRRRMKEFGSGRHDSLSRNWSTETRG